MLKPKRAKIQMTDNITQRLTAPGAPFEFADANIRGMQCKLFKDTPSCLPRIFSAFKQHAERDFVVYQDRRLTYRQTAEQACLFVQYLKVHCAITANERIAIAMRNAPEWLVVFLAITSLGAVPVLVNGRGAPDEIAHCVTSAKCRLLLTDTNTEKGLDESEIGSLKRVTFDLTREFSLKGDTRMLTCPGAPGSLPQTESPPDSTAMILFTSGTTGRPKGVLLTHRGVLTALKTNQYSAAIIGAQMAEKYAVDLQSLRDNQPQPCTLLLLPLFHVSGCEAVFLTTLLQGGKIVMMPKWDAAKALRLIENEQISMIPGVPAMFWDMLSILERQTFDLRSLLALSVAGQSTPVALFAAIKEAFPRAIIGCGYGMTETNGAVSLIIGSDLLANPGTVGPALATTEIKLMQNEITPAAIGERGEIYLRGATVMRGYDDNPEANKKSFVDGWYRTGDIGVLDADGYLYIVDRATEMVISSGENIYCAEVERVLDQAESVLESVTFGLPDERLGERLVAVVRAREGSPRSAGMIAEFARTKLAAYKVPAEIYFTDAPLPRTETGKILKNTIRKLYENRSSG